MRTALVFTSLLLLAGTCAARADSIRGKAPADEYFGPQKQSILEIRNRLDRYDAFGDRSRLDRSVIAGLDALRKSISDWQRKYPHDPWLPRSLRHLMHEYWRAGAGNTVQARAALGTLRSAYANAPETRAALSETRRKP